MIEYDELIKNINILLADDDEDYMAMTYAFLKQFGYNVDKAKDGRQALSMLKTDKYQIALLDYYMPELTGEEVVKEIRKDNKELIIILQTGFSGQKPPIETMKKLGIQNYYDKTEGIDRLNLELMSAVKIFNQQNEIELSKYRANAIGNLVFGLAHEIKSNLLSIGAGLEYTNIITKQLLDNSDKEKYNDMQKYYQSNKDTLEKLDKVLSSIINQSTTNTEYVLADDEIIEVLQLVLKNKSKMKKVNVDIKAALKTKGYIKGCINDCIFIISELVHNLLDIHEENSNIEIVLTDDEEYWYFKVTSNEISGLPHTQKYLIKRIIATMNNTNYLEDDSTITIALNKV